MCSWPIWHYPARIVGVLQPPLKAGPEVDPIGEQTRRGSTQAHFSSETLLVQTFLRWWDPKVHMELGNFWFCTPSLTLTLQWCNYCWFLSKNNIQYLKNHWNFRMYYANHQRFLMGKYEKVSPWGCHKRTFQTKIAHHTFMECCIQKANPSLNTHSVLWSRFYYYHLVEWEMEDASIYPVLCKLKELEFQFRSVGTILGSGSKCVLPPNNSLGIFF